MRVYVLCVSILVVATISHKHHVCRRDGRILAHEEGTPAFAAADMVQHLQAELVMKTVASFINSLSGAVATVVSLSGGVDSMVICQALCYLRDHPAVGRKSQSNVKRTAEAWRWGDVRGAQGEGAGRGVSKSEELGSGGSGAVLSVAAVHIDYGNRHESREEATFLEMWCRARRIQWFSARAEVLSTSVFVTRFNLSLSRALFCSVTCPPSLPPPPPPFSLPVNHLYVPRRCGKSSSACLIVRWQHYLSLLPSVVANGFTA